MSTNFLIAPKKKQIPRFARNDTVGWVEAWRQRGSAVPFVAFKSYAFGGVEHVENFDHTFALRRSFGRIGANRNPRDASGRGHRLFRPQHRRKNQRRHKTPRLLQPLLGRQTGKLWLEIDKWNTEFLYQTSLPAGIGSNDIGLDRGQMGETTIVRFERIGPKILLIQSNLDYRAVTSDPDERAAVRDSFAESALWGFTLAAEDGNGDNARVLVDATDFFLRDTHHVPEVLARTKQGAFKLDDKRCAILSGAHEKFPTQHRSGSHAHFCRRSSRPMGERCHAVARVDHRAGASFVRAASAARLQAARV